MERQERATVVIIGAGFGGLAAARALARSGAEVHLYDRNNYHTFFPLLYQVGAAELEVEEIAYPVRSIFRRQPNVHFHMQAVSHVDLEAQTVEGEGQVLHYDYLILALGTTVHFFGVEGAAEFAFPLKSLEQAAALRNHILRRFELAAQDPVEERRRARLTFVVVGGGPTGVEFAGALAELIRGPLLKDYTGLATQPRLLLLEGLDHLLHGQPKRLQDYARQRLERMGIEVHLNGKVSGVGPQEVRLQDGSTIPTETVVWTAGVRGEPQMKGWGLPTVRGSQVVVRPTLQVAGHPQVYGVGDLAQVEGVTPPYPMIAPVAIQEGKAAAENVMRQMRGHAPIPFEYHDRGTLATIGRNSAVAFLWGRTFTGFVAWGLWLGVHLYNLIGFRNRLIVLINWAWDYIWGERGVRLVLPAEAKGEARGSAAPAPLAEQKRLQAGKWGQESAGGERRARG